MKLTNLQSVVFLIPCILATPHDQRYPYERMSIRDMPVKSIALCPEDHWRPLSPYKSTGFPEPWWFLPDADEANKDHYDVTHPSLPSDIILPDPLLPTDNATIKELYAIAIQTYDEDLQKPIKMEHNDCDVWMHALNRFDIMCRCVHMWWWQCSEVGREGWQRTFDKHSYVVRYRRLKELLQDQMRKEGLITLGKRLKALEAEKEDVVGKGTGASAGAGQGA